MFVGGNLAIILNCNSEVDGVGRGVWRTNTKTGSRRTGKLLCKGRPEPEQGVESADGWNSVYIVLASLRTCVYYTHLIGGGVDINERLLAGEYAAT